MRRFPYIKRYKFHQIPCFFCTLRLRWETNTKRLEITFNKHIKLHHMKKHITLISLILFISVVFAQKDFEYDITLDSLNLSDNNLFLNCQLATNEIKSSSWYLDNKNLIIYRNVIIEARYVAFNYVNYECDMFLIIKSNTVRILIQNIRCVDDDEKFHALPFSLDPPDPKLLKKNKLDKYYAADLMVNLNDELKQLVENITSTIQQPLPKYN